MDKKLSILTLTGMRIWPDENALTIEDRDHPEQRFKTLGLGPGLNVIFVVHAERNENCIRIISARKAGRSQTKQYYQGLNYEWRFQ